MKQLQGQFGSPRKVWNLYFTLQRSFLARPMIGLLPGDHLVNNIVFMDDVSEAYANGDRSLLSVTVLEADMDQKTLISQVQQELSKISGVKADYFKFLKLYEISYALPHVDDMKYEIAPTACKITDQVFLAGDYLLNGSINAAMTSGRTAAQAIIHSYMPTH